MQNKFQVPPPEKTHDISDVGEPLSVLMLDDEKDFTDIVQTYLEEHGFRVTCVKNGVEGLKKIMVMDFDAIVCDMMMPTLPGDMFYLAVQKTKPHLCKRFLFVTGHKGEKKIDDFIRSVKGLMIFKPVQLHELLGAIRAVIKKAKAPKS